MSTNQNVVAAFSEEHAHRLTGVTLSQLRYWDRSAFYRPSYAEDNRRLSFSRVYSFRDIVALRSLNVLRNQYNVPLQHLRAVSDKLSHLAEDRWTGFRMWVVKRRVVWQEPGTERPQEILSQQYVVETLLLDVVINDTKRDVSTLNLREPSKIGHIERIRYISHNTPVIAGTRIPVSAIKEFHSAGYKPAEILKEYPDITAEDVAAAIEFSPQRATM